MKNDDEGKSARIRKHSRRYAMIALMVATPVFYFLLTGPALMIGTRFEHQPPRALIMFMKPLIELDSRMYTRKHLFDPSPEPFYRTPMLWYFQVWGGEDTVDLYFHIRIRVDSGNSY